MQDWTCARHLTQPANMIGMKVREEHTVHLGYAKLGKPRRDPLALRQSKGQQPPVQPCTRRFLKRSAVASVEQNRPQLLMPDDFEARGLALEDLPLVECAGLGPAYDVAGDGTLLAVPLPGHAAGQCGLLCQLKGGTRVLLCADAAWLRSNINQSGDAAKPRTEGAGDKPGPTSPSVLEAPFPGGRGSKALGFGSNAQGTRPAWPVRLLADDYAQFHHTLDRLDAFARAFPDVRIVPSHCEESIGPID